MSFGQISILFVVASFFGILAKSFKQPIIVGFLFAGFVLSTFGFIGDHSLLENLGKIGVTLLLFLVGLEMNLQDLKSVGKVSIIAGVGQIVITTLLGFILTLLLGFTPMVAVYISLSLTFSSTIIIIKLLSEKDDVNSLYGKISIGILLVQDFVAILILIFLGGIKDGNISLINILLLFLKSFILFGLVWYLSKDILPKIFSKLLGGSQELTFIVGISWALGIATLVGGPFKFSYEIGGFLAGLALSNLPDHLGISSKTKSLRDFFLTIFFITLGSQLVLTTVSGLLIKVLVLSLFVLVGNPLIVMLIMGVLGHKSRTSFFASVTIAQVSEFSFILMTMGKTLGHVSENELSMVILVGAITMIGSTYLILGSEKIYLKIKNLLKIFERKNLSENVYAEDLDLENHVVLIGCDKIGSSLLPYFKTHNYQFVVVDFNPDVFTKLVADNINVFLGDITDQDILNLTKIDKAKIIISTIPNFEENNFIIDMIKKITNKPIFVASSNNKFETLRLYENGADYVLNPDIIAGEFLRHMFKSHGFSLSRIAKMGKAHFNRLMYLKSYKNI